MKWITRSHVHVDRVACPWLIRRFLDSAAEFLFVPKSQVLAVAAREKATSFDTPGARYHHDGDLCTFSVLVRDFELTDKALQRLARIVNAADTGHPEADPLAPGLEAIAVGFGLRNPDDMLNLERQFEVYDALYAWCRLEVARESNG
ncbi:MAG: chromate resistance protein [Magnetococcales bacterium]|nr:chromate resistance protein [Magnetococcales bacterium]MBF0157214.1 chromate resistance protein [Magnetococcales bacterium]